MTEAKWTRKDFGYECEFTPTIIDGPVFRWTVGMFEISASRSGVVMSGHSHTMSTAGMTNFMKLVRIIEWVHVQLSKNDRPDGIWFGDEFKAWTNITSSH